MFEITKSGRILLTKGDSASLNISLEDAVGKDTEILDTDIITMLVDNNITFTADKNGTLFIDGDVFNEVEPGVYTFTVRLNRNGEQYTIIDKNFFELREDR